MFRIPELLAPAGGMEQLKAAVENGADAVYMGGKLFNARINAANFDDAEMKKALDYAHMRGVRIYVAMNTLIKDSELEAALDYAALLHNEGADALIIQDLGFAKLVRENIPGFQMHLSTQGTVYNVEGVKKAKNLGFSRVVPARELTLTEIREITDADLLEIEVFAHGALCICYSGQCQMSREIGGRSGNRGECAQPCRLPYSVYQADEDELKYADRDLTDTEAWDRLREVSKPYFALSPKDLCTVEYLGRLAEAGVASLKIEGRMKTPEYVAVSTGIYRKYLDLYAKYGDYRVEPADLKDLNQIFSRGGFTEGYLFGNPEKKLMSGDLSKHQGIYIGKVIGYTGSGKTAGGRGAGKARNRQSGLVTVRLAGNLSVGDGIEIRNGELPGNLVTFMKHGDKKADSAETGDLVTVGYVDGNVSPGDPVYKITDKELMQRARASFEGKSGTAEKAMRKTGVSFHFIAGLDRPVSLSAADDEGNRILKELPDRAEKALTRAITEKAVKAQLSKTGGTPFRVTECTTEIEDDISIPLSKINELRRTALEELETHRRTKSRDPVTIRWSPADGDRKTGETGRTTDEKSGTAVPEEEIFLYYFRVDGKEIFEPSVRRIYVPYDAMLKGFYQDDDRVVPVIPNITQGRHDRTIRKNFDKIVAASAEKGIAIGNLGWIDPFAEAGVDIFGDYGLNLYNSMDFLSAGEMGIKEAVVSHEAELEDILMMEFHGVVPEVAVGGRIPVMVSGHCPVGDLNFCGGRKEQKDFFLKDRKGQFYPILADPEDCRSMILSHRETNLSLRKEDLKKAGLKRFRIYVL